MKEIDLSALDDLEGGLLLSPEGGRSVAQDSFETNECRRKATGIDATESTVIESAAHSYLEGACSRIPASESDQGVLIFRDPAG